MTEKYLVAWGPEGKRQFRVVSDIKHAIPQARLIPPSGSSEDPNPHQVQLYELRKKDFQMVLDAKLEQERNVLENRERAQLRQLLAKYPDEISGSV